MQSTTSCNSSATRIGFTVSNLPVSPARRDCHPPYRPDCVNHVPRGQTASPAWQRLGQQAIVPPRHYLPAVLQNLWTTRSVNRAVNPAAAHQRRIGGVHDSVHRFAGYVGRAGDHQRPVFRHCDATRGRCHHSAPLRQTETDPAATCR